MTTGASSDLQAATRLARDLVTKYGMSSSVGLISQNYEDDGRSLSSEMRARIEEEVNKLLRVRACARGGCGHGLGNNEG